MDVPGDRRDPAAHEPVQALVIYGVNAEPRFDAARRPDRLRRLLSDLPIAMLPLLFLLYPDGHPPSRGWRWAVSGLVGGDGPGDRRLRPVPRPEQQLDHRRDRLRQSDRHRWIRPASSSLITIGTIVALDLRALDGGRDPPALSPLHGLLAGQMRVLVFVAAIAGSCMLLGFVGTWSEPSSARTKRPRLLLGAVRLPGPDVVGRRAGRLPDRDLPLPACTTWTW